MDAQRIAIDIGYGDTKVMANGKLFKFPSAISQVGESMLQLDFKSDNPIFEGIEYRVGSKALMEAVATRGYLFLKRYSPLLIHNALLEAKFDLEAPIEIATGLSIVNNLEAQNFLEIISNFTINQIQIKPRVFLFAQGQGLYYQSGLDKEDRACVIDIGYNTLDFLVFENGKPRVDLCFANKKGANLAITNLQKFLIKEFRVDFNEQEAKEVFVKKEIEIAGKKIDFSDVINSIMQRYVRTITDEVFSKAEDILSKTKNIVIGGGGAYFLKKEYLEDLHKANYLFLDNPEYSNVLGYYKSAFKTKGV
ncbi:hypothetical protein HPMG_01093 [Helicobacter pullorum MIT 98-5489]|uniref:Uncharacterized protein n=1 Tax=Helicobacter pullorum MIT 98-5489 TaxID=537972 RepID=C5F042_9HELI|nr:ParM/StbA family protein [Helicobacter pullorum]EEQ63636.1 hypothetical protein HPMG_01093 [Helicobacter pullorum MIT 98-5489]